MLYITAVHMDKGEDHSHISKVKLWDDVKGKTIELAVWEVMLHIRLEQSVFVKNGSSKIPVVVVDETPPYIRTKADGIYTDNLLELPRY